MSVKISHIVITNHVGFYVCCTCHSAIVCFLMYTDVLFLSLRQLYTLHKAAEGGDLDKVRELVEKQSADVNIKIAHSGVRM